jgi:hypothetical protein
MEKQRVSVFEEPDDIDTSVFVPKGRDDAKAPRAEQVRPIAEAANFPSREGAPPKMDAQFQRSSRRYRTGRNVQLNVKAQKETVDAVYAVCEAQGWVLGYTLQRAIEALQRELKSAK